MIRHLIKTFLIFSPAVILSFFIYFTVNKTSEYKRVTDVISHSDYLDKKYIYSPRYRYNAYPLKLELLKKTELKRFIVGSSRAHQSGPNFFLDTRQFLNLSGTVRNLSQLSYVVDEILNIKQEEIQEIVIILDFWWFRSNFADNQQNQLNFNNKDRLFLESLIAVENQSIKEIFLSSLSMFGKDMLFNEEARQSFIDLVLDKEKMCGNYSPLGFSAFVRCSGYDSNGRYIRFDDEIPEHLIANPVPEDKYFLRSGTFCDVCFENKFATIINKLVSKQIEVTLVLPPIPKGLNTYIRNNAGISYVLNLEAKLKDLGKQDFLKFINGHLGTLDNRGFYDKYHPKGSKFVELISALHN